MISWAALQLLASGGLKRVLKGLSKAAEWLISDWRNLPLVIFGVAALWQGWVMIPARDRTIADTEALLTATQLAHIGTIANFMDATEQAERDAEANAARVKTEQEAITDATVADYRADLAALRDRFDRFRADRLRARDAARTDPRRADRAGLPGLPDAPGRAAAAPTQDRLPAAGDLSLDDALIASEQALQLNALIDWIEAQSAVRFTPAEPRR